MLRDRFFRIYVRTSLWIIGIFLAIVLFFLWSFRDTQNFDYITETQKYIYEGD